MNEFRILIVEDDFDFLSILRESILKLKVRIETAQDGKEAISKAEKFLPDIILMKIQLPLMDGIEVCKSIRRIKHLQKTLIIFLAGGEEEYLEVLAFDAGAYDYILKPQRLNALNKKISIIREREFSSHSSSNNVVKIKDLIIDKSSYSVYKGSQKVVMPKMEFELLNFLSLNPDCLFSREELLKKLWGKDIKILPRTVDVHIRKIRKKIGEGYIETIKGVGYKVIH